MSSKQLSLLQIFFKNNNVFFVGLTSPGNRTHLKETHITLSKQPYLLPFLSQKIGERGVHNMYMDVYTILKQILGFPSKKTARPAGVVVGYIIYVCKYFVCGGAYGICM